MLAVAETVIGQRTCYGLAYPDLVAFYGRIGFIPVNLSHAPEFLQARWAGYRERGVETVPIMRSVPQEKESDIQ